MSAQTKGVDVLVLLTGAVDALSQNAVYPADVALALRCIGEARDAIAELTDRADNAEKIIRNCGNAGQIGAGYLGPADDLRRRTGGAK